MKIVYFERLTSGHRLPHLQAIVRANDGESVLIVPEHIEAVRCKQYVYKNKENKKRSLKAFMSMLDEIKSICDIEKPDIVHFLDGNIFYRFFGLGLKKFKKYKIVLTNHNAKEGFLYRISTKMIANRVDVVTVTSEYSEAVFKRYGAKNVINVEYPQFNDLFFNKNESMSYYGINTNKPILLFLGGTRFDKGIDILLESLKRVQKPFHLLIAGKEEHFSRCFIEKEIETFKNEVTIFLNFMSDKEFAMALSCCDYVILPYRKGFNGASGPLCEGVWRNKCIVGPSGKNLGDIIENHHLGYTFEQENTESLALVLNDILGKTFLYDQKYQDYRNVINHREFEETYRKIYQRLITEFDYKDE